MEYTGDVSAHTVGSGPTRAQPFFKDILKVAHEHQAACHGLKRGSARHQNELGEVPYSSLTQHQSPHELVYMWSD